MKIVLTKPYVPQNQRMSVTLPIGLLYMASYIRRKAPTIETEIVDPDIYHGNLKEFISTVVAHKPDIISVTVYSHALEPTRETIAKIKERVPKTRIVIGGAHINAVHEKALRQVPQADYAIYGEGERGLLEFCRQISKYQDIKDPEAIPGFIARCDSGCIKVENSFCENLAEFDPLDYNLIDMKKYFEQGSPMGVFRRGKNLAQIITTRGCPFRCTFCASPINMGTKVRKRPTDNILKEIEALVSLGVDEIHVMDDNFTFDRQHVIDLCQGIIKRNIRIHFAMPNGVRLDKLDADMLMWMKKAGWYHIGFGIEVGSDQALKKIRKALTMKKIEEKIRLVKNVCMTTTGFFILGFPHDDLNSIRETIQTPDKLGLDMASFGNFTPLPGTQLYSELVAKGEIGEDYLPSFALGNITYSPRGISPEQLKAFQTRAVLRYWVHPKRLKFFLTRLKIQDFFYIFRRLYQIVVRPK